MNQPGNPSGQQPAWDHLHEQLQAAQAAVDSARTRAAQAQTEAESNLAWDEVNRLSLAMMELQERLKAPHTTPASQSAAARSLGSNQVEQRAGTSGVPQPYANPGIPQVPVPLVKEHGVIWQNQGGPQQNPKKASSFWRWFELFLALSIVCGAVFVALVVFFIQTIQQEIARQSMNRQRPPPVVRRLPGQQPPFAPPPRMPPNGGPWVEPEPGNPFPFGKANARPPFELFNNEMPEIAPDKDPLDDSPDQDGAEEAPPAAVKATFPPKYGLWFRSEQNLEVSNSEGLPDLNSDFTVEAYVRFPELPPHPVQYIAGNGVWPGMSPHHTVRQTAGWELRLHRVDGNWLPQFVLATKDPSLPWNELHGQPVTLDGKWHHIAGCREGNTLRLFWDGQLVAQAESGTLNQHPSPFYLGQRKHGHVNRGLDGELGGFRLSNVCRYSESLPDIPALASDASSLVYYDFAEVTNGVVEDLAAGVHAGQLDGPVALNYERRERPVFPARSEVAKLGRKAFSAEDAQLEWATYLQTRPVIQNTLGMTFALIPPGEYSFGPPLTQKQPRGMPDKEPRGLTIHGQPREALANVRTPMRLTMPFLMGTHEVTVAQFQQFVTESGYVTEKQRNAAGPETMFVWTDNSETSRPSDSCPVTSVTWNDAVAFAEWLTHKEGLVYRLPTEVEWEYACKAGTSSWFYTGDRLDSLQGQANVAGTTNPRPRVAQAFREYLFPWEDGFLTLAPVEQFPSNAWQLHDMQGNVSEWCADTEGNIPEQRDLLVDWHGTQPANARVHRGSSCYDFMHESYSHRRRSSPQNCASVGIGFRLVRDVIRGHDAVPIPIGATDANPAPAQGIPAPWNRAPAPAPSPEEMDTASQALDTQSYSVQVASALENNSFLPLAELFRSQSAIEEDEATRAAMLTRAHQYYVEAGRLQEALLTCGEWDAWFVPKGLDFKVSTFLQMSPKLQEPLAAAEALPVAFYLFQDAIQAQRYDLAEKLKPALSTLAATAASDEYVERIAQAELEMQAVQAWLAALAEEVKNAPPEKKDQVAASIEGMKLCFLHGQWTNGLSALTSHSDQVVQDQARQEVRYPASSFNYVGLAGGWYDLAQRYNDNPIVKRNILLHARMLYLKGLPTRVAMKLVRERLIEISSQLSGPMRFNFCNPMGEPPEDMLLVKHAKTSRNSRLYFAASSPPGSFLFGGQGNANTTVGLQLHSYLWQQDPPAGDSTHCMFNMRFSEIRYVRLLGMIRSPASTNLRLTAGQVQVIFNWEAEPSNHFRYAGERALNTAGNRLEPGRMYLIEIRQNGTHADVTVDGRMEFSFPCRLEGLVDVHTAWASHIDVHEFMVDGTLDNERALNLVEYPPQ